MTQFVVTRLANGAIYAPATLPTGRPAPTGRLGGKTGRLPSGRHPKMLILTERGRRFTVPFAPRETTLDGIAPTFTTVDRAGRAPLLLRSSEGLPSVQFELWIGHWDPEASIEGTLKALREVARTGERMRVVLDASTAEGLWRLTSMTQTVTERQHGTNAPTRATATLQFQRASDPVINVGPVSGGAKPAKPASPPKKAPARVYTVKRGDTLWAIARRYYGNGALYPRIADANKIRNPHLIFPGQRFRIP